MADKYLFGEMTNREVAEYLEVASTIIVPVGTTEQHGDHLPLGTDAMIATEIANRVAREIGALVAPPISYGLSITHKGAVGLAYVKPRTFMSLIEDIAISLTEDGFRTIVFCNGHYDNGPGVTMALRTVYDRFPEGTLAFNINYWETMSYPDQAKYLGWEAGLHANVGETAAVMAFAPQLVQMENAKEEWPELPDGTKGDPLATVLGACVSIPGSWPKIMYKTGVWGRPQDATPEKGEEFLSQISEAVAAYITDVSRAFKMYSARQAQW